MRSKLAPKKGLNIRQNLHKSENMLRYKKERVLTHLLTKMSSIIWLHHWEQGRRQKHWKSRLLKSVLTMHIQHLRCRSNLGIPMSVGLFPCQLTNTGSMALKLYIPSLHEQFLTAYRALELSAGFHCYIPPVVWLAENVLDTCFITNRINLLNQELRTQRRKKREANDRNLVWRT